MTLLKKFSVGLSQRQASTRLLLLAVGTLLGFQNCAPATFSQAAKEQSTGIVCGGVTSSANCNPDTSNVVSEIYSLGADARALHGSDGVDTYFTYGEKIPATLLMDQIFIPTRLFSAGFPVTNSSGTTYLQNKDGEVLMEYFALRLKTNLSLTANQGAGLYQLALLSDDGSRLYRLDTGEKVVDNDTTHSTSLGCGKTIQLAAGQTIPLQIDYYQGPATQIALTLMWRKVASSDSSALSDPLCDVQGNEKYFGDNYDDYSADHGYGQLLSRGWSAVPAANLSQVKN